MVEAIPDIRVHIEICLSSVSLLRINCPLIFPNNLAISLLISNNIIIFTLKICGMPQKIISK